MYRPINRAGRAARKAVFYTVSLNVEALVSGVNMPSYYDGSYFECPFIRQASEGLTIEEGDVLVWDGRTAIESTDEQGFGGFMMIKHEWD